MTIQPISSANTSNYGVSQQHKFTHPLIASMNKNELLTPELKNTLQDDFNAKLAEQASNIKSTYQTAKDMDLTHSYYQQQQKLLDIYMESDSQTNSNKPSAVHTLTNAYASLYDVHQQIKEIGQQRPSIEDESLAQINPLERLPIESKLPLFHRQTETYNSLMMPTTKSYLHLNA